MKLQYFADTDTLYIDLADGPSAETEMVTENLTVDFDADKKVIGITLEHASQVTDLATVKRVGMPTEALTSPPQAAP